MTDSAPTPSRKYGRRAPPSHPTTPWFMSPANDSPTSHKSSSPSLQDQDDLGEVAARDSDHGDDPFTNATTLTHQQPTVMRRTPRRAASRTTLPDQVDSNNISPTTTPKARKRTLSPHDATVPIPTQKTVLRRSRSDPFSFDEVEPPVDPPSKRVRKAVVIPESLVTPTEARRAQPAAGATVSNKNAEQSKNVSKDPSLNGTLQSGPKLPALPRGPSPQPTPVVAKPALPVALQLEPIGAVIDDFAFDMPPVAPPPAHSSTTAASSTAQTPSRPPLSPPITRLVIPRSESQVLGNFFDSDDEDEVEEGHEASTSETRHNNKQTLKRKASMDAISAPPTKKVATGRSAAFDIDLGSNSSDSQGSNGGAVEIRTLHEMREAGENRRIAEEAEFLAQGLDASQPLTLRQYSALDLVRKLVKPAQRRKLASNNSLSLLLDALSQDADPIIMLCFLVTVYVVLSDSETHHVAIQSLSLDRHLFRPHFLVAHATAPPLPNDSKQARVMVSDLTTLADSVSISHDMLCVPLLWTTNVHKLVHLAPATVASAMDPSLVASVVIATLGSLREDEQNGLKVTDWATDGCLGQAIGLLEQLSFISTAVATALKQDQLTELHIVPLLGWFAVRVHAVLVAKLLGEEVDGVECTKAELDVDAMDVASALLTTLRLLINVTHAEPQLLGSLISARDGDDGLLPPLLHAALSMLTGPLGRDPIWIAVHRRVTAGGGSGANHGGGAGGSAVGGGYSQSSQSQPAAVSDVDPIASLSDRTNAGLVAVGLLLNLAEGAPEGVGDALAREARVEGLVHVIEGATSDPDSATGTTAGVISAFAAVVLATALVMMDASAREQVRTTFACATWATLRRALERFVEYQRAGEQEGELEGQGESSSQGQAAKDDGKEGHKLQGNDNWLLLRVNEWL